MLSIAYFPVFIFTSFSNIYITLTSWRVLVLKQVGSAAPRRRQAHALHNETQARKTVKQNGSAWGRPREPACGSPHLRLPYILLFTFCRLRIYISALAVSLILLGVDCNKPPFFYPIFRFFIFPCQLFGSFYSYWSVPSSIRFDLL